MKIFYFYIIWSYIILHIRCATTRVGQIIMYYIIFLFALCFCFVYYSKLLQGVPVYTKQFIPICIYIFFFIITFGWKYFSKFIFYRFSLSFTKMPIPNERARESNILPRRWEMPLLQGNCYNFRRLPVWFLKKNNIAGCVNLGLYRPTCWTFWR